MKIKFDKKKISEMTNQEIEVEIKSSRIMTYLTLGTGLIVCLISLFQNFTSNVLESQIGVFVGTEALFMAVAAFFMIFEQRYKIELRLREVIKK